MSALVPLNDIKEMAEVAAKSKMFGFKNPDEAMAIMLLCQAESLHPAIAMRDYHVIQGRPALKADAILARFQQAGGSVKWETYTDECVSGTFSHPAGGSVNVTWTFDMAKKIGLTGKDNWRNYPRAMLRSRCVSEGVRTVYPGCVVGVYTDEETEDFSPRKNAPIQAAPKDMGAAEVVMPEDVVETDFPLYLPDGSVYAYCDNWKDYSDQYINMMGSIKESKKLDAEAKAEKLLQWTKANEATVAKMDAPTRVAFMAAKQGVDTFEDLEDAIER